MGKTNMQIGFINFQGKINITSTIIEAICPQCGFNEATETGKSYYTRQLYRCNECGREFILGEISEVTDSIFSEKHRNQ